MEMIMSEISNATALQNTGAGSILGRLAAAPKRLCIAFITWRVQRMAVNHLRSMGDRELQDIGLSRSQIEGAVTGESARDLVFSRYC
jgi:uncharacterized protein YjiS (DUF1127 family)